MDGWISRKLTDEGEPLDPAQGIKPLENPHMGWVCDGWIDLAKQRNASIMQAAMEGGSSASLEGSVARLPPVGEINRAQEACETNIPSVSEVMRRLSKLE